MSAPFLTYLGLGRALYPLANGTLQIMPQPWVSQPAAEKIYSLVRTSPGDPAAFGRQGPRPVSPD